MEDFKGQVRKVELYFVDSEQRWKTSKQGSDKDRTQVSLTTVCCRGIAGKRLRETKEKATAVVHLRDNENLSQFDGMRNRKDTADLRDIVKSKQLVNL